MKKEYIYTYEFLTHNYNKTPAKYEKHIQQYVSPLLKPLAESFLQAFDINEITIRYGITIEGYSNLFNLTASIFSTENNKMIGNIIFPNSEQYHQILELYNPEISDDLSLQCVISAQYQRKGSIGYTEPVFSNNALLVDNPLCKSFVTLVKSLNDNNCFEYDNGHDSISIEILHTMKMSYWQSFKKFNNRYMYSFARKVQNENDIKDIILSLSEIDYVFKKTWFKYDMITSDYDSLIKMARLQNY